MELVKQETKLHAIQQNENKFPYMKWKMCENQRGSFLSLSNAFHFWEFGILRCIVSLKQGLGVTKSNHFKLDII
jgi:hypothetical protein